LKTPTKQNPTHDQYCAQISEPTLKKLSRPRSTASWDRGDHPTGERRSPHLLTISTLCKQGHFSEALGVLGITGKRLDCSMYICLLQGCIQRNALPEGKVIHAHIKQSGFTGDTLLHNTLLNVYAKCGTMVDARKVFDQMPERNACSWTVMIAACTRDGLPEEALALFHRMSRTGLQPNHFTFATVLPACANSASLWKGVEIHWSWAAMGMVVLSGNYLQHFLLLYHMLYPFEE
jgi:pentatricopeptide repeat protein